MYNRFVFFLPTRSRQAELLDEAHHAKDALSENFRDIARINRFFGGASAVLRLLDKVIETLPNLIADENRTIKLLDIATGAADIPLAVLNWARSRRIRIEITATDYSTEVLDIARETISGSESIKLERANALKLPYKDSAFDISVCSLALHHFSDEEAAKVLREMNRVSKSAFIVNDLRRSPIGYLAAQVYGRLLTRNRLTRNDAPLSVKRAFTVKELNELAANAGIERAEVEKQPGWRLSLLCIKPEAG